MSLNCHIGLAILFAKPASLLVMRRRFLSAGPVMFTKIGITDKVLDLLNKEKASNTAL